MMKTENIFFKAADFLLFETMFAPVIIRNFFSVALLVIGCSGLYLMMRTGSILLGLAYMFVASLIVRIVSEAFILLFKMHDRMKEIADSLAAIRMDTQRPPNS